MGAFAADDDPGPLGPGTQVDEVGDIGDLSPEAGLAITINGGNPSLVGGEGDRVSDPAVDVEPEAVADVAVPALLDQPV